MREKVGSARSLGDMEVKKSFWNWREKAAPWKELVTTAEDVYKRQAVPGHHHGLARHHQVGGVHDGIPNRLAGAVLVVIVVLGLGVVHRHHGAGQDALPLPGLEAQDAGCRCV